MKRTTDQIIGLQGEMDKKPVALLVGEDGFDAGIGGFHYVINKDYAVCLERLGIVPFLAYDIRNVEDYVKFADLLCLTGGADIHPGWYREYYRDTLEMEGLSQERDALDFALCRRFIEEKKPILAIGRGLQVVNVALGGTLCRDVCKKTGQNHWISDRIMEKNRKESARMHLVSASGSNFMSEVCGERIWVNSYHRQGIECLGKGFSAAYQAEDGTIEAVFHQSLPILGVQWHPEQPDWENERQIEVFQAFKKWSGLEEKKKGEREEQRVQKPLILVNGGPAFDSQFQRSAWIANRTYSGAVSAAGGVPLMPLAEHMAEEYACFSDAFLWTGSISFVPKKGLRERLKREEMPKRRQFDQALFWSYYQKKKPILGICLGHQMINYYLGGTLEGDFRFRTGVEHMLYPHRVRTEKESVLSALFGEVFWVNSRHNDKIDRLAEELYATAWSEDGVIEAFEHKELPIYGVEWHPERMRGEFREPVQGPDMTKLFTWFIRQGIDVKFNIFDYK